MAQKTNVHTFLSYFKCGHILDQEILALARAHVKDNSKLFYFKIHIVVDFNKKLFLPTHFL